MINYPLFITNPTNIRYLTGFVGSEPTNRDAYVLLTENVIYLYTNSLYIEQAKELKLKTQKSKVKTITQNAKQEKQLEIIQISRDKPVYGEIEKMLKQNNHSTLFFEQFDLKYYEYELLKKSLQNIQLVPKIKEIEMLRMIKQDEEIRNIKKACEITDSAFDYIVRQIKPGVTENEIRQKLESYIYSKGAELAFTPIVSFGSHTSQPHYISQNYSFVRGGLAKQEIIQFDYGARINGYCSDMSRMIFIGDPKKEWVNAYITVKKAQEEAVRNIKNQISNIKSNQKSKINSSEKSKFLFLRQAGIGIMPQNDNVLTNSISFFGAEADKIAKKVIENAGYQPYSHSLGHSLGLDIHEGPRLTIKYDEELQPNMVFTIEPGIYVEGKYGIRIEDTVLLTDTTLEILTKSSKEMIIIK
jgi:Xaa-Pro aminopeptidase